MRSPETRLPGVATLPSLDLLIDARGKSQAVSEMGLGRVKTKSDLVVMPSGRQIFAFFALRMTVEPKIPGAVIPPRVFTQPGSSTSFQAQAAHFHFSPDSGRIAASHRSATKSADARRGAAVGGELCQAAGPLR